MVLLSPVSSHPYCSIETRRGLRYQARRTCGKKKDGLGPYITKAKTLNTFEIVSCVEKLTLGILVLGEAGFYHRLDKIEKLDTLAVREKVEEKLDPQEATAIACTYSGESCHNSSSMMK